MAISTNGVVLTRFAAAVYNQQLSNATYNEVVTWSNSNDLNNLLNAVYNRDFATIADSTVANTIVTNLGLTAVEGLGNWLTAQITAAGTGKGAAIASILNGFAQMGSDATYGTAATTFNTKVDNAQAASQTTGNTGGSFSDVGTAVAGKTFTLTTSADTGTAFTGGAGNDTYTGLIAADGGTGTTMSAGDNLNGGAGTDTLNVNVSGATTAGVTVGAVTLAGIEKVLVSNFDTGATDTWDHDFNAALWTGLTTLGLSSSAALGDTKFSNVASIVTAEMKSGAGDLDITYASAAVAGTADTQTLVLDAVSAGTFTADASIETVAVIAASTASASTLTDLVATGATKITIDSDVALTITNALDATAVTVDGSASAGGLSLNFTAAAANLAVTGGTGNDTFVFDATGTLTADDTVAGGTGTDTIKNVSAQFEALDAAVMTKVTGIEALAITDDATGAETLTTASFGSIIKVTLEEDTAGAYGVTFATGGGTVVLGAGTAGDGGTDALGGQLTITASGTATTDAATFEYGTATADANGAIIATSGVETLTINNTKAADTTGAITMSAASTGGTTKVVFTGDKTMTVGAVTAATVNASALTGTAALVMTAASVGATSITGAANADTLYGIAAAASTIDGGAGNDSITGGTAADNLTGGTGDDTLVGAGGNDVITGGDGNDSINVSGDAGDTNINGGAGNDTITFNSRMSALDTVDGGAGTDTIAINSTDITAVNSLTFGQGSTLNTNISNIEKVSVGGLLTSGTATNILDMSRLDSINYVVLTADGEAATQVAGMAEASTVEITGDIAGTDTDTLTLAYASTTGTNSLTLMLNNAATVDLGVIVAAGIENVTVNSTSTNATPSGVTNTVDLTVAAATTLTVTGNAIAALNAVAINAATINASANTAGFTVLGGSANQTITGTAAADNIDGGAGADTIDGGAGADTLNGGTGADSITAGEGADTVTGGSGNDTIVLTETTAAVDDVVINWSEGGTHIDTVIGFATTSSGDELQFSLGGLEAVVASGGIAATTDFAVLADGNSVTAAAGVAQVMTTTAAAAAGANVFVLSGATFSSKSEVEDALETGGAFAITGLHTSVAANDAFIAVWTDGTSTYVTAMHHTTETADDGDFEAGNLTSFNLVTLTGVSSIGSTTFAAGNFEWIA